MNLTNLEKRLFTSIPLIILLIIFFIIKYILIISLICISLVTWIEFQRLIFKVFKNKITKFFVNTLSFIYLLIFSLIIFFGILEENFKINILYLFFVCIFTDIGGLLFGKIFKGKKLTKISPNKTISGAIGSFVLSLILVPIYLELMSDKIVSLNYLIIITLLVSFISQLGDLFISYFKRKAKVKDTGNILPGHGGFLDRIDGILFAIPSGILIWKLLL